MSLDVTLTQEEVKTVKKKCRETTTTNISKDIQ